ncbi:hypothetical protein GWC95_08350 [Sediminibacterium roseum]|uniref:Uncharacterized protein n=1 Tax=Sediminibacterium roseum TaxID=1978412 RepID=A0ABW9ZSJ1_9BACT|nr:hypothetical protein [Sediminibacterium roseum]NCI49929.1 hypothetical protein [Sediminibacterium roseum]
MRTNPKSLLIALAFGLLCYALVDGIRSESGWGVAMALCSMVALYISIRLSRKLASLSDETEESN